jgi:hypothetical protein
MSTVYEQETLFDLNSCNPVEDYRIIDFPVTEELIYYPHTVQHITEFYPNIDPSLFYPETELFVQMFAGLGVMITPDHDDIPQFDHKTFYIEFENGEVHYRDLEILWHTNKAFLFPCEVIINTPEGEKRFYIAWNISRLEETDKEEEYERTCERVNTTRRTATPLPGTKPKPIPKPEQDTEPKEEEKEEEEKEPEPEILSEQPWKDQYTLVEGEYTKPDHNHILHLGQLKYIATVIEKHDHRDFDTITEWVLRF